jgi:putative ATP-binding cassette transporter
MLSAALLFVILLVVGAAYAMNAWNRAIFDSLQDRDTAAVARLSILYFAILAVSVLFGIAQVHFRMAIHRRWRAWLNDQLVDRWLSNGRYYQLNLVKGDHANPEYRIADDLRIATESPVDFVSGVTHALLSAATFMVVLWTVGGALDVTFAGIDFISPAFSYLPPSPTPYSRAAPWSWSVAGSCGHRRTRTRVRPNTATS